MGSNIQEFQKAIRLKIKYSKQAEAEIVNQALLNVAFKAASYTPKASQQRVVQQLTSNGLLPALASIACNRKYGKNAPRTAAGAKTDIGRRQGRYQKLWGRIQHKQEMFRILASRRRGLAALRAGWIPAIQAFGGTFRGAKLKPGGSAEKGTGKKATVANLIGFIRNSVTTKNYEGTEFGAGEITVAIDALYEAVRFVTRDIMVYARRKMREALKK